jgi:hypothetical protein
VITRLSPSLAGGRQSTPFALILAVLRHNTPAQVADTLRAKLSPEILDEVLTLLREQPPSIEG